MCEMLHSGVGCISVFHTLILIILSIFVSSVTRLFLVFSLYMNISGAALVAKDAICCRTVVERLRSYNLDMNILN